MRILSGADIDRLGTLRIILDAEGFPQPGMVRRSVGTFILWL